MSTHLERKYQAHVIAELHKRMPGCVVLKNDANYMPGIPDLIILFGLHWGMLEVKTSAYASKEPNQEYYVQTLGEMSYVAIIYPENEEDVLYELQSTLQSCRDACILES